MHQFHVSRQQKLRTVFATATVIHAMFETLLRPSHLTGGPGIGKQPGHISASVRATA